MAQTQIRPYAARCGGPGRGLNVVRVMTRQGLIWQDAGGQGVLFDCDGVLVDSDASVERAWRRWTDEYGLPVHQVLDMAHGRRSGDTVRLLIPGPGQAAAQQGGFRWPIRSPALRKRESRADCPVPFRYIKTRPSGHPGGPARPGTFRGGWSA